MYTFDHDIFINVPQQEIFDYLTDPTNDSKWRGSAVSAEWTSEGPIGVGSTQNTVDKFLGRKIESTSEVTVWDPPNQYSWKSVGGPIPYELTIKLTPQDDGTLLSFGGQAELGGFFKLAEGMAGNQMVKQVKGDFENLKKVLEAS